MGFFSTLDFISERTNVSAHAVNIIFLFYFLFLGAKACMVWPAWCGHRCSLDVVVESALILAFVFEDT